jgi:hypothetical protein
MWLNKIQNDSCFSSGAHSDVCIFERNMYTKKRGFARLRSSNYAEAGGFLGRRTAEPNVRMLVEALALQLKCSNARMLELC